MGADWPQVAVAATPETSETLEAWLLEAGAISLTLHDAAAGSAEERAVLEPAPGELRLWQRMLLVALFGQGEDEAAIASRLALAADALGIALPEYRSRRLADAVWERSWMADFAPRRFGERLWICPSHHAPPDPAALNIRLDPGLAFGSGAHATTALCLEWLGRARGASAPPAGLDVIDYGCGSGVLAIAAALLGARHVRAVDIDPQALEASARNARANGVAARVAVSEPEALGTRPAELLLANILAGPLLALAERFARLVVPGGTLVLSGLLVTQIEPLRLRYNDAFEFEAPTVRDGWARLVASRRAAP